VPSSAFSRAKETKQKNRIAFIHLPFPNTKRAILMIVPQHCSGNFEKDAKNFFDLCVRIGNFKKAESYITFSEKAFYQKGGNIK
jgi:hypothetical protein